MIDEPCESMHLTAKKENTDKQFVLSDRAKTLYRTATQEKVALIRLWQEYIRNAEEANDSERLERQEWAHNLSCFREQMHYDMQVSEPRAWCQIEA